MKPQISAKEANLERTVGDYLFRLRLVADMKFDTTLGKRVVYGPLTVYYTRTPDGVEEWLAFDFDDDLVTRVPAGSVESMVAALDDAVGEVYEAL